MYESPFVPLKLLEKDHDWSEMYDAFGEEEHRLFAPASFGALRKRLDQWIEKPGTMDVYFSPDEGYMSVCVQSFNGDCTAATLEASLRDIILAAARSDKDACAVIVKTLRDIAVEVEALMKG